MHREAVFPVIVIVWLAVTFSDSAHADVITYEISGTVNTITDTSSSHYVPTSIQKNVSSFVGTFSFDNAATGTISGNNGYYHGKALNLSVNVLIDGQYNYLLTTPSDSDEIDILGTSFGLYKRGPIVQTTFAPYPPFSHLDFHGTTQTNILSNAKLGSTGVSAGVSDAEATGQPYYYIGANLTSVQQVTPEPSSAILLAVLAGSLLIYGSGRRMRRRVRG